MINADTLVSVFDTVIRNGVLALPDSLVEGEIAFENGQIAEIGSHIAGPFREEIDAQGKLVMPGAIDTQVHFREPGMTHKEDLATGSTAAIVGGVTTVFEMPNTTPTTTNAQALQDKLNAAKGRMRCDHAFFVGASPENVSQLAELERLPGTPGIKIFMGSSTGTLLVSEPELLARVLQAGTQRCSVHSELESRLKQRESLFMAGVDSIQHPFLRDAESAVLSTRLLLETAKEANRPVHILHISTADEVQILKLAKTQQDVTCEVTPQHLAFAAPECYRTLGTLAKMNPPLRDENHQIAIQRGLSDGVFDVFGSDHAPHLLQEKQKPYAVGHDGPPSGMPGVQTILPMAIKFAQDGLISLEKAVAMLTSVPAQLFGIKQKGQLKVGYDADVVIIDHLAKAPLRASQLKYKCGWSAFENVEMAPMPSRVFLHGALAATNGEPVGDPSGQMCRFDWK